MLLGAATSAQRVMIAGQPAKSPVKSVFNNKPRRAGEGAELPLKGNSGGLLSTLAFCIMCISMQQLETPMATLTIRNVDAAVKERLRVRAARHGRSMEAEARTILSDAVAAEPDKSEPNLAEAIRRRFAPLGGVDLELPPRE